MNNTDICMKEVYKAPTIRKKVEMILEAAILIGSNVEKRFQVETASQQVVDHDISDTDFNHDWK